MNKVTCALIGDFQSEVIAHIAIQKTLEIENAGRDNLIEYQWIPTESCEKSVEQLHSFDGVWCVPASPYKSLEGALNAIQYARENNVPFLGTCGGYQHAVLEYARNVLDIENAENAEVNPDADLPLIAPLQCALIEQHDAIHIFDNSAVAGIYQHTNVKEKYHCSYGVNAGYLTLFANSELKFTGFDDNGDPRVFELEGHPFFIGTAFQPERSALENNRHPLLSRFVDAMSGEFSLFGVSG